MRFPSLLIIGLIFLAGCNSPQHTPSAKDISPVQSPAPQNVIIMIADGCGFSQIEAASYYQYGELGKQPYDSFAVKLAMSTFSAGGDYLSDSAWLSMDYILRKPTDSAAAATAMATGHKTYNGAIGVDVNKKPLKNILEIADSLGKATGVVTTVPLSHATPAAFSVHNVSRKNYAQIAREMILESPLEVIMGAGHPDYDAGGKKRETAVYDKVGGRETWEKVLAGRAGADADGDGTNDPWTLVEKRGDIRDLASSGDIKRVLAVPYAGTTLQEERPGDVNADPFVVPFNENVPTLSEMSLAALNVLNTNHGGFYLMIEGGAVDWAGHANRPGRLIEEEIAFNKAVRAVMQWIEAHGGWQKNLLIVTGDHETGLLSGPGMKSGGRMTWKPVGNKGRGKLPGMEFHSDYHSNSLIPFFARGTGSSRFFAYVAGVDSVRGKYIDNTAIGRVLKDFLRE